MTDHAESNGSWFLDDAARDQPSTSPSGDVAPPPPLVALSPGERRQLERWSRSGTSAHRLVVRSRIVLLAAGGLGASAVARRLHISRSTVRRWLARFAAGGTAAVASEAKGRGRPPGTRHSTRLAILKATLALGTQASVRQTAALTGVSTSTTWRVWRQYGLQQVRDHSAVERALRRVLTEAGRLE